MSRIAEYKQIDTQVVERTIYHEADEEREAWEEVVTEEIPVMGVVYRDSTPEEDEEAARKEVEQKPQQIESEIASLKNQLADKLYDVVRKMQGDLPDDEWKAVTDITDEITNKYDELGKVVQTTEGNGTMEDPIKGWSVGMDVEQGKWYLTTDGYLWEAIKSGKPSSTTDREYFDVVGL